MLGPALALALAAIATPPSPYAPEERMSYAITYAGLKMGEARISVGRREGALLPILLDARTSNFAGLVRIREQLASYVEVATGLPRMTSLDAVEPNYRHSDYTRFDRAAGKATIRQSGKSLSVTEVPVPPGTLDFIAMVFRLRKLSLEPGARYAFPVLAGKDVARVTVEVMGRETLDLPAGKFAAVQVRVPTGFTGKFSEKSPTFVWFSDDARRIILRLSTDFVIGRARADLVSYQPGVVGG